MSAGCRYPGCGHPVHARGLCATHYSRWWARGSVEDPRPSMEERFWAKVDKNGPNGCWQWTASLDRKGYGQFNSAGRPAKLVRAHRLAYELIVGSIPANRPQLDHLCRNRACVNPEHLEPVTNRENGLRGERTLRRTRNCPHGFDALRNCPDCRSEWRRDYKRRQSA